MTDDYRLSWKNSQCLHCLWKFKGHSPGDAEKRVKAHLSDLHKITNPTRSYSKGGKV